jgi:DNA-binding transcriptional LysR family regulator
MIAPEVLQGFDLLLWLGNGRVAAAHNGCSQPTISRQAREVADLLQLSLRKRNGAWQVYGDTTLLAFERQLHQLHRLLGRAPLRLEIGAVSGRLLGLPAPPGWIAGPPDRLDLPRSLELLRQRVIDAWITPAADDLPELEGADWHCFELYSAPVWLVAAPDHPLVGCSRLPSEDLLAFPSAGLEGGWYPRSEAHLRTRGLWSEPRRVTSYEPHQWDGRTADGRTLAYASPPMLTLNPGLRRLDHDLKLRHRAALVVSEDHAEAEPIQRLKQELHHRTAALAKLHPELTIPCRGAG